MFNNYKQVTCGALTPAQQHKYEKTGKVALTAGQVKDNTHSLTLHPESYKKFQKSKLAGKGVNLSVSPGEVAADLATVSHSGAGMHGGSLWGWLKNKAWPWLKNNWSIIKPVVSAVADVAIPAAATAFGAPSAGVAARAGLKQLTGVGMGKGSDAAKAKMAHLRSLRGKKKSTGGSFILS